MVQTKFSFDYFHRPTIEWLGLVILALVAKQIGQVAVAPCNVRMILAEDLFADLDGPTIERLGLAILALVPKQIGEIAVTSSNVGMTLAQNPFTDLDRP